MPFKGYGVVLLPFLFIHLLLLSPSWCAVESHSGTNSIIGSQLPSFTPGSSSRHVVVNRNRRKGTRRRRNQLLQINSVASFGARGDGSTDDTHAPRLEIPLYSNRLGFMPEGWIHAMAFVQAWNRTCSSRTGAVLHVPQGYIYLVRPITLAGPCRSTVKMLILGTILAPSDPDAWVGLDRRRWLSFHGLRNLVLTGGGTINGRGQLWWERSCKINTTNPCHHAPAAVTFHRISHLVVEDLTLVNSQQMHVVFNRCSKVSVSSLNVIAPAKSPNTDGIHISSSNAVFIRSSMISTGDDCISIVGNSSNVLITDIVCGPGHGISIGSLGKSNSTDRIQNVQIDGALISNTENGVRIKTWQGGQGYARNINFHNVIMENVSNPIIIDQYYCDSKLPCQNQTSAVKVHEISFARIRGTSATKVVMKFACSDTCPCENIHLEDIWLSVDSGEDPTTYCWNASGSSSGLVYPPSCLSVTDGLIEQNIGSYAALRSTEK